MTAPQPTSSAAPSSAAWRPLLEGEPAERAAEAVEDIAGALRPAESAGDPVPDLESAGEEPAELWRRERGFSLAGGKAGLALFFAYLDAWKPGQGHDDTAVDLLGEAIDTVGSLPAGPSLYGGFSGVSWAVEHLQGRVLDPGDEDVGEEVAAALAEHLAQTPWRRDYDLIGGIVGLGTYALERLPRKDGRECLERAVERLAETAEHGAAGSEPTVTWLTPPELLTEETRALFPQGNYNLGVAHGVPGVIGLLGEALTAGVAGARPLLEGAVTWLLRQKLPPGSSSVYSYNVAVGGDAGGSPAMPARMAWCYGDLGLSVALLAAARAAGRSDWEAEALAIAAASARRPEADGGVMDPGLCHGAAGAAHLFNRLFQASGDPLFAGAARRWFDRTLEMRRPGEGVGGFMSWSPDEKMQLGWRSEGGFLTGAAGVGLALIGGLAPVEPAWDRVLLAAIPARRATEA